MHVKVPIELAPRYRGRKDYPTQNVLVACSFDSKFTYVLVGWEGMTSDSRIVKSSLTHAYPLKVPQGKYYLGDAGFPLKAYLITPALKKRFPILQSAIKPTFGIKTQNKITIACCILHNYLMGEDPNQTLIDDVQDEFENERGFQEGHQHQREENDDMISGEPIKDNVAGSMWLDY
ncbi:uncharacterized protein LOC127094237 [Lathyrus oleraceus]|uniref:uncharacterized protein LOC127094237 n=1 Tax=Pisum sativum TaxID=3888 RepID=UPI0021D17C26|nr:uncharacterized protein LOC127094237 [Pisum sativum]